MATESPAAAAAPRWKAERERGAVFWFRAMLWIARSAGRRACRVVLLPVVGYYLLTARAAQRVSRDFLTRALGRPATRRDVARHLHRFGAVVLDRLFVALGRAQDFDVVIDKPAPVDAVAYGPRGCLLFVSHLGSFEALRLAASERGPLKVLLDLEHNRKMTAFFRAVNPALAQSVIDVGRGGPGVALAVKQALDERHRVGIMVDRPAPGEPTVPAAFLGQPAPFPTGPWLLAAALQAPVVLCFGLYEGGNRYRVHFELFSERLELPRAHRLPAVQACIQRYAQRLEHYARRAPYNWFNFYDFWEQPAGR